MKSPVTVVESAELERRDLNTPASTTANEPTHDRLWKSKEAAAFLGVCEKYLWESSCPRILLPGNGEKGRPMLRYDPAAVREWAQAWRTGTPQRRAS